MNDVNLGDPIHQSPGQTLQVAGFLVTEMHDNRVIVMPTLDCGEQIEFIDAEYFELSDREHVALMYGV